MTHPNTLARRTLPNRREVLALALMALVLVLPVNLLRRDVTLIVKEVGIPETCRQAVWWQLRGSERSSAPVYDFLGYCGAITTDHGGFEVVETGSLFPGAARREDIVSRLRPGCRYTVSYYGLVSSPQPGDLLLVGGRLPVIYSIRDELDCAQDPSVGQPDPSN